MCAIMDDLTFLLAQLTLSVQDDGLREQLEEDVMNSPFEYLQEQFEEDGMIHLALEPEPQPECLDGMS